MRIGSLFSGAGGLDMAVEAVFGGRTVWHSEIDKAASKVLAHRWPDVPNLGSITEIDWAEVQPVDVLCGGFPCQDVSAAGKRAGIKDGTRSGLWAVFADAIDALRPRYVVIENVRGLLSATAHRAVESDDAVVGNGSDRPVLRALGAVLGDLSDIGYDAQWTTIAAADVGAPHRRERVFIVATNAGHRSESERAWEAGRQAGERQPVGSIAGRDSDQLGVALLPTPQSFDQVDFIKTPEQIAEHSRALGASGGPARNLREVVVHELLPTPAVKDMGDRVNSNWDTQETLEWWAKFVAEHKAKGYNGNGHGRSLAIELQALLPTPTTQDGANNGGPSQFQRNTLPLNAEVKLLPTPNASDSLGGGSHPDRRVNADGLKHGRSIRDYALLHNTDQWGKYAPAIARWEQIVGPAPAPTEPNKNGNPRLSAEFSEWLMGWPAGWVTDPAIDISRNDQLRIVGNGVCTQQAVAALRYLLAVAA